jgi:ribosomal protein S18 acetylase RimI-like enzyme
MDKILIRLAEENDAEKLFVLNEELQKIMNLNSLEHIIESIKTNNQEIIIVSVFIGLVVGFCCAQINKSICYFTIHVEITELYVQELYRRKRIASKLINFIENYCFNKYGVKDFHLLTGQNNHSAQRLYESLDYRIKERKLYIKGNY